MQGQQHEQISFCYSDDDDSQAPHVCWWDGKGEWDTAGGGCVENRKWSEGNLSFVRVQSVYVQYKKDGLDSELSRSVEIRRGLEIRAIS